MSRGRLPTPTAIKELNGNPGKRSLPKGEPKPEVREPDMPPHWRKDGEAAQEWRRVVPEMLRLGMLTRIDRGVLAAYCEAWEQLVLSRRRLQRDGHFLKSSRGTLVRHPAIMVQNEAIGQIARLASHLGISPAARTRIHALPGGTLPGDDFDEWEKDRKVVPFGKTS